MNVPLERFWFSLVYGFVPSVATILLGWLAAQIVGKTRNKRFAVVNPMRRYTEFALGLPLSLTALALLVSVGSSFTSTPRLIEVLRGVHVPVMPEAMVSILTVLVCVCAFACGFAQCRICFKPGAHRIDGFGMALFLSFIENSLGVGAVTMSLVYLLYATGRL